MKTFRVSIAILLALLSFGPAAARADETSVRSATTLRHRGNTKTTIGAVFVAAGALLSTILMATGAPLHLRDASRDEGGTRGRDLLIASVPAGTALFLVGMPLLVSGHDDRERAARVASQPALVTLRY